MRLLSVRESEFRMKEAYPKYQTIAFPQLILQSAYLRVSIKIDFFLYSSIQIYIGSTIVIRKEKTKKED